LAPKFFAGASPAALLEPVREALEGLKTEGFGTSWQPIAGYLIIATPVDAVSR
jgi:acetylornithine deacetylase